MFWRLLPHLTACVAADRVVLLDIRQDRYFLVPPTITLAVCDWLRSDHAMAPPSAFFALLRDSAILRAEDGCTPAPTAHHVGIPVTLETPTLPARATLAGRLGVALAMTSTRLTLRRRPLAVVLKAYRDRPVTARSDRPDAIALARRFGSARRQLPFARQCLPDSLALAGWLKHRGVRPTLVFGVAAPAFAAHCWVQQDTAILNDSFDRVSRFTPILTL